MRVLVDQPDPAGTLDPPRTVTGTPSRGTFPPGSPRAATDGTAGARACAGCVLRWLQLTREDRTKQALRASSGWSHRATGSLHPAHQRSPPPISGALPPITLDCWVTGCAIAPNTSSGNCFPQSHGHPTLAVGHEDMIARHRHAPRQRWPPPREPWPATPVRWGAATAHLSDGLPTEAQVAASGRQ